MLRRRRTVNRPNFRAVTARASESVTYDTVVLSPAWKRAGISIEPFGKKERPRRHYIGRMKGNAKAVLEA